MNTNDIANFFTNIVVGFDFKQATRPLDDIFDGFSDDETNKNRERFDQLKTMDKLKVLNLKVRAIGDGFNQAFISVVRDTENKKFVVFFNLYEEFFMNFSSFFEVDDDARILVEKLHEFLTDEKNNINPDALTEVTTFK